MCSCGWILRTAFSFSLRWLRRHISYGMNIRQQVTLKIVCNNKYEVLFCSQHTTKLSLTNYVQQQKRNIFFFQRNKNYRKKFTCNNKNYSIFCCQQQQNEHKINDCSTKNKQLKRYQCNYYLPTDCARYPRFSPRYSQFLGNNS